MIYYFVLIIFISYATPDLNKFKIPYIAHKLEEYPEIDKALFWQEDTGDDIVDYMNDNIPHSDILILFCSEQSLSSDIVKLEWKAALELRKKILPVFEDVTHIPPILRSLLGVEFNDSDIDEIIQNIYETIGRKIKQPLEYKNLLTPSQITENIRNIKQEFQNKLDSISITRDFEMRILTYPLFPRENLFNREQFPDLKDKLERNVSRGLMIDSISPAIIFNELDVDQNGFYSISRRDLFGNVIIKKNGFIIYNFHYNKEDSNPRELLPTYYMAAYFLGLLELLLFFYNEVEYEGELNLFFNIHNIHEWKYSRYPSYIPYDDKEFSNGVFKPIERRFHVKALEDKEGRFKVVEDIFSEMILGYGETTRYNIPDELKNQ